VASTLLRLTPGATLKEDKDFGIKGFVDKLDVIKSRNSAAGGQIKLIYEQETGFSNVLTNFQLLLDLKLLGGTGTGGYYLNGLEEKKFKKKKLVELYNSDPEFKQSFDDYCQQVLVQMVPGGSLANIMQPDGDDFESADPTGNQEETPTMNAKPLAGKTLKGK